MLKIGPSNCMFLLIFVSDAKKNLFCSTNFRNGISEEKRWCQIKTPYFENIQILRWLSTKSIFLTFHNFKKKCSGFTPWH